MVLRVSTDRRGRGRVSMEPKADTMDRAVNTDSKASMGSSDLLKVSTVPLGPEDTGRVKDNTDNPRAVVMELPEGSNMASRVSSNTASSKGSTVNKAASTVSKVGSMASNKDTANLKEDMVLLVLPGHTELEPPLERW